MSGASRAIACAFAVFATASAIAAETAAPAGAAPKAAAPKAAAVPAATAPAATPEDGARAFYAVYLAARVMGLPTVAAQRRFAPTLSTSLASALAAAGAAEDRHFKATKNQEPPLWEGDPFTSLFEGAQRAKVERCRVDGERAECDVALGFRDPRSRVEQSWHDRARLVRERGGWVVDDIAYGGGWDFGPKGTLKANLAQVAAYKP